MPYEIKAGDILELKKEHPCGGKKWEVLREGMDLGLKCCNCGHYVLVPRVKVEKNIKNIIKN
jgi:hypothetical protein